MKQIIFIKGMKRLCSTYLKGMSEEQLSVWYDMLKIVSDDVFLEAIKEITNESPYMPNAPQLYEKCSTINKTNILAIIDLMYKDGYFHRGVNPLDDEHALRNKEKTCMWLMENNVPSFLKEDIEYYMKKYKQSKIKHKDVLKIEC